MTLITLIVPVIATVLIGFSAVHAMAKEPPPSPSEGTIYYPGGRTIEDPVAVVRQGIKNAGGSCTLNGSETLGPGEVVVEIERSFDPATCTSVFDRGVAFSLGSDVDLGQSQRQSREEVLTQEPDLLGGAASRQEAYNWSWYDEPARWMFECDVEDEVDEGCLLPPVNTVRDHIVWVPGGSCPADVTQGVEVGFRTSWFTYSGWVNPVSIWQYQFGQSCGRVFSRSDEEFRNAVFCQAVVDFLSPGLTPPVEPTETKYRPNEVEGYGDGTAVFRWNVTKSGGCDSFLQFGRKSANVLAP